MDLAWESAASSRDQYNWNYVDQLICGYHADLVSNLSFWRLRLAILPELSLLSSADEVDFFSSFFYSFFLSLYSHFFSFSFSFAFQKVAARVAKFQKVFSELSPSASTSPATVHVVMPTEYEQALAEGDGEISLVRQSTSGRRTKAALSEKLAHTDFTAIAPAMPPP